MDPNGQVPWGVPLKTHPATPTLPAALESVRPMPEQPCKGRPAALAARPFPNGAAIREKG
ncbi:hypothetical protein GmRootA79_31210 [Acidovorax sp. A79]